MNPMIDSPEMIAARPALRVEAEKVLAAMRAERDDDSPRIVTVRFVR